MNGKEKMKFVGKGKTFLSFYLPSPWITEVGIEMCSLPFFLLYFCVTSLADHIHPIHDTNGYEEEGV